MPWNKSDTDLKASLYNNIRKIKSKSFRNDHALPVESEYHDNVMSIADCVRESEKKRLPCGLIDYVVIVGPAQNEVKCPVRFNESNLSPTSHHEDYSPYSQQATPVSPSLSQANNSCVWDRFPKSNYPDNPLPDRIEWFICPKGSTTLCSSSRPFHSISTFILSTNNVDNGQLYGVKLRYYINICECYYCNSCLNQSKQSVESNSNSFSENSEWWLQPLGFNYDNQLKSNSSCISENSSENRKYLWISIDISFITRWPLVDPLSQCLEYIYIQNILPYTVATESMYFNTSSQYFKSTDEGINLFEVIKCYNVMKLNLDCVIVSLCFECPFPVPGLFSVAVTLKPNRVKSKSDVSVSRRINFNLSSMNRLPICSYSMVNLLERLGSRTTIDLICCALSEKRILLHSSNLSILPNICECIVALLYPLKWTHVYLPVIPAPLLDLIDAPVPFMLGVHSDWIQYLTSGILNDVVVVNCDINVIDYNMVSSILELPDDIDRWLNLCFNEILIQFYDEVKLSNFSVSESLEGTKEIKYLSCATAEEQRLVSKYSQRIQLITFDVMLFLLKDIPQCLFYLDKNTPIFNRPLFLSEFVTMTEYDCINILSDTNAFHRFIDALHTDSMKFFLDSCARFPLQPEEIEQQQLNQELSQLYIEVNINKQLITPSQSVYSILQPSESVRSNKSNIFSMISNSDDADTNINRSFVFFDNGNTLSSNVSGKSETSKDKIANLHSIPKPNLVNNLNIRSSYKGNDRTLIASQMSHHNLLRAIHLVPSLQTKSKQVINRLQRINRKFAFYMKKTDNLENLNIGFPSNEKASSDRAHSTFSKLNNNSFYNNLDNLIYNDVIDNSYLKVIAECSSDSKSCDEIDMSVNESNISKNAVENTIGNESSKNDKVNSLNRDYQVSMNRNVNRPLTLNVLSSDTASDLESSTDMDLTSQYSISNPAIRVKSVIEKDLDNIFSDLTNHSNLARSTSSDIRRENSINESSDTTSEGFNLHRNEVTSKGKGISLNNNKADIAENKIEDGLINKMKHNQLDSKYIIENMIRLNSHQNSLTRDSSADSSDCDSRRSSVHLHEIIEANFVVNTFDGERLGLGHNTVNQPEIIPLGMTNYIEKTGNVVNNNNIYSNGQSHEKYVHHLRESAIPVRKQALDLSVSLIESKDTYSDRKVQLDESLPAWIYHGIEDNASNINLMSRSSDSLIENNNVRDLMNYRLSIFYPYVQSIENNYEIEGKGLNGGIPLDFVLNTDIYISSITYDDSKRRVSRSGYGRSQTKTEDYKDSCRSSECSVEVSEQTEDSEIIIGLNNIYFRNNENIESQSSMKVNASTNTMFETINPSVSSSMINTVVNSRAINETDEDHLEIDDFVIDESSKEATLDKIPALLNRKSLRKSSNQIPVISLDFIKSDSMSFVSSNDSSKHSNLSTNFRKKHESQLYDLKSPKSLVNNRLVLRSRSLVETRGVSFTATESIQVDSENFSSSPPPNSSTVANITELHVDSSLQSNLDIHIQQFVDTRLETDGNRFNNEINSHLEDRSDAESLSPLSDDLSVYTAEDSPKANDRFLDGMSIDEADTESAQTSTKKVSSSETLFNNLSPDDLSNSSKPLTNIDTSTGIFQSSLTLDTTSPKSSPIVASNNSAPSSTAVRSMEALSSASLQFSELTVDSPSLFNVASASSIGDLSSISTPYSPFSPDSFMGSRTVTTSISPDRKITEVGGSIKTCEVEKQDKNEVEEASVSNIDIGFTVSTDLNHMSLQHEPLTESSQTFTISPSHPLMHITSTFLPSPGEDNVAEHLVELDHRKLSAKMTKIRVWTLVDLALAISISGDKRQIDKYIPIGENDIMEAILRNLARKYHDLVEVDFKAKDIEILHSKKLQTKTEVSTASNNATINISKSNMNSVTRVSRTMTNLSNTSIDSSRHTTMLQSLSSSYDGTVDERHRSGSVISVSTTTGNNHNQVSKESSTVLNRFMAGKQHSPDTLHWLDNSPAHEVR